MRKSGHVATSMVLFLICLMYLITYIDRVNISTAAIVFRKELNLTNAEYGWIFSAFAYTYAMFQIIGGFVGDRFGPRRTLGICGCDLGGGDAGDRARRRLLVAGHRPRCCWASARAPPSRRRPAPCRTGPARDGAVSRRASRIPSRGSATPSPPPLVAYLILAWSWRGSFVVLGVVSLVWVVVWFLYFRDNPREHTGISEDELNVLPAYRRPAARARRCRGGAWCRA